MSLITYTVNGTVGALGPGPYSYYYTGIDGSGVFGPAGASILGDHFWATWTVTGNCQCIGVNDPNSPLHLYDNYPYPSPVIDITLQIGNQPYGQNPIYDFGNGGLSAYGEVRLTNPPGGVNTWLQLTTVNGVIANGGISSTSGFKIGATSGLLTHTTLGIPGPNVGTGWLGMVMVLGALAWWLWRRQTSRSHPARIA
jgi:hypothetical protein